MRNPLISGSLLIGITFTLAVVTWGETQEKKAAPKSEDGYHRALGVLTRHCAGCHQAADHPGALFLNRAGLSEPQTLSLIIELIERSQMPPAHAKFKKTKEGKLLLTWLKGEQRKQQKKLQK